jgi:hypothetical protein
VPAGRSYSGQLFEGGPLSVENMKNDQAARISGSHSPSRMSPTGPSRHMQTDVEMATQKEAKAKIEFAALRRISIRARSWFNWVYPFNF